MKSNSILFIASFFCTMNLVAQNLVLNPDFELRDSDFCGIAGSTDLENSLSDWYSPSIGTPDVYFTDIDSTCWNFQPNSAYPGPIGVKGEQMPRSGTSMTGIGLYTISGMNQREYIQVELNSPTVATGKYLVECYVSLADFTEFSSDNLGFYLSTTPQTSGSNGLLTVTPQYVETTVIGEINEWVRVFDTITVTDAYQYLTIGNFSDDASTTTIANPTASFEPGMYGAYYFIDDVRVERVFTDTTASVDQLELIDVRVFPNPVSDEINIEFSKAEVDVLIELVDLNGKLIYAIQGDFRKRAIDLSGLGSGVYIVRIETSTGVHSKRIVKK